MIYMYTGTNGSGKTYHVVRQIYARLRRGCDVLTNIFLDVRGKIKGEYIYKPLMDITPAAIIDFARAKRRRESSCLVVIDEAQLLFNARNFSAKDRWDWIRFFPEHRKYGLDIILVTPYDRMIDRQIRVLTEYEVRHRVANRYGFIGGILSLFGIKIFVAEYRWYGMALRDYAEWFLFRKKYARMYDTMAIQGAALGGGAPAQAGGDPPAAKQDSADAAVKGGGSRPEGLPLTAAASAQA